MWSFSMPRREQSAAGSQSRNQAGNRTPIGKTAGSNQGSSRTNRYFASRFRSNMIDPSWEMQVANWQCVVDSQL